MIAASDPVKIVPMSPEQARQVAELHIARIPSAFLSSLGAGFLTTLYDVVARGPHSFGYVVLAGGRVVAMATFTTDLQRLYRHAIRSCGWRLALGLSAKLCSWQTVKRLFETLFYPRLATRLDLPKAEILSLAVAPDMTCLGLGPQLIQRGLEEFRRRGIGQVKILAAQSIQPVNRMYQLMGLTVARTIAHHGVTSNLYVVATDYPLRC